MRVRSPGRCPWGCLLLYGGCCLLLAALTAAGTGLQQLWSHSQHSEPTRPHHQPRAKPPTQYSQIDAHALAAPKEAEKSLDTLAAYLTGPARTEQEKARAIFRWICARLSYDGEAFYGRRPHPDPSAESALRTRLVVCDGFANLFQALASRAGLKCEMVTGHAKAKLFMDGLDDHTLHAWNAVSLDGKWELLDATFGAGGLDQNAQFSRDFDEFWFLTPPEQFIYTHLPQEARWQLLARPIQSDVFLKRPLLMEAFFRFGLQNPDEAAGRGQDGTFRVQLQAPTDLKILADAEEERGQPAPAPSGPSLVVDGQVVTLDLGRESQPSPVLVSRQGQVVIIDFAPPRAGDFDLEIRAGGGESRVATYQVKARAAAPAFPHGSSAFERRQVELVSPPRGQLKAGTERFTLKIPGAVEVQVINGKVTTPLVQTGESWTADVQLSPGDARVSARFADKQSEGLLLYQVQP